MAHVDFCPIAAGMGAMRRFCAHTSVWGISMRTPRLASPVVSKSSYLFIQEFASHDWKKSRLLFIFCLFDLFDVFTFFDSFDFLIFLSSEFSDFSSSSIF